MSEYVEEREEEVDILEPGDDGYIDPEQQEEEEEVVEVSREDFLTELLGGEGMDQDEYDEHLAAADKYNLTNEQMEKYNEVVRDLTTQNDDREAVLERESEESMQNELSLLSEEERSEVPTVFEFFEQNLPEEMKAEFDKSFQTAEGFRMAKFMMDGMSQDLPNLESRNQPVVEFGHEEYSQYTDKIRAATNALDFDKARLLKAEMKSEITRRGTDEMKKDLAPYL